MDDQDLKLFKSYMITKKYYMILYFNFDYLSEIQWLKFISVTLTINFSHLILEYIFNRFYALAQQHINVSSTFARAYYWPLLKIYSSKILEI